MSNLTNIISATSGFSFGTILGGLSNFATGAVATAGFLKKLPRLPSYHKFLLGSLEGSFFSVKILENEEFLQFLRNSCGSGFTGAILENDNFFQAAKIASIATSIFCGALTPSFSNLVNLNMKNLRDSCIAGAVTAIAIEVSFSADLATIAIVGNLAAYIASANIANGVSNKTIGAFVGSLCAGLAIGHIAAFSNRSFLELDELE